VAIRDLLWACPACRQRPLDADDACKACGTRFRRRRGDQIQAIGPEGKESRRAAEWLASLPAVICAGSTDPEPVRWRRMQGPFAPVHFDGQLVGWVESFDAWTTGTMALRDDAIELTGGEGRTIPLGELGTIQPVSRGVQLRTRDGALVSVRFDASSVLRWQRLLEDAVRRVWVALGRPEPVEFQPRIKAR
jgi:hypothetical protein